MDLCCGAIYNNTTLLLCLFLPLMVFGQLQLSSSIGSLELSGEQCPGILTLTCDARNFGSGRIIWFVGNQNVAEFDAVIESTPFVTTTTRPEILNATVQLTSATFIGNQSNFINFTLSASVSNFLTLQGQNISCGTLVLKRSFGIKEFTINESTLYQDVSYLTKYNGPEGRLMEVMLNWTENRASNCPYIISYSVIISNDMSTTRNFTSEVCSSSQCSYEIDLSQYVTSDIIILEFYADGTFISITTIASTTGNNVSVDKCSGEISIRCSDLNKNKNCTINYQQDGMDFNKTVLPSNISALPMGVQDFQITMNNGSTILQQNVNDTLKGSCGSSTSRAVIVGVVIPVVVVLVLILVVIIIVLVTKGKFSKKKTGSRELSPEAEHVMELHGINKEGIQFDEKGMSNVEGNVMQAHKKFGEKKEPALLKEKERVTMAAHEVVEAPIYDQTEQIGDKQNIANTFIPANPSPSGMYSKLNSSDEYSSLQNNTNGAQGQSPPAVSAPTDECYEQFDLSRKESPRWCRETHQH